MLKGRAEDDESTLLEMIEYTYGDCDRTLCHSFVFLILHRERTTSFSDIFLTLRYMCPYVIDEFGEVSAMHIRIYVIEFVLSRSYKQLREVLNII